MSNQTVLNALQAQLAEKKNKLDEYKNSVYNLEIKNATSNVLSWLRDNVSPKICDIIATEDRLEIMKAESPNSGWAGCSIYLTTTDYKTKKQNAKMNWYSSSLTVDDENMRIDVEVFGAIASKLHVIEHQMINTWSPIFKQINKSTDEMLFEIHELEKAVRGIQFDIRSEEIGKYKKVGFECTLNKNSRFERNWETDEYEIRETEHSIKLSTGRARYDYVWVNSFKVVEVNKYKATIEVGDEVINDKGEYGRSVRKFVVSIAKFEDFIESVYNWQNDGSQKAAAYAKERFDRHFSTEVSA